MKINRLSIEISNDLPTEFRIFTSGTVDTVKGEFLFDAKASKLVLEEYAAHGIDLMIDYDHASLTAEHAIDPALSGKAAGWFNLELRNGELWAVNVRWSPPAAKALRNKEWRFMSPAFQTDDDGRVTSLLNVALTNIPATRKLQPLVAASKKGNGTMDPSLVKQALEAIEKGDAKAALDILKGLVASAAGADPEPDGDEDGSSGDGAEGVASPDEAAAVDSPKVVDAAADPSAAAPKGPNDGEDDDDGDEKPAKKAAYKAMRVALCTMTGVRSFAEALVQVNVFKASHLALEVERQKLARERATLESAERRTLVVELVRLGAEFPSTVWADDKATAMKPRWSKMSITELRAHVADQRSARSKKPGASGGVKPAAGSSPAAVSLSAEELTICEQLKCKPEDFAALKAFRDTSTSDYVTAKHAHESEAYTAHANAMNAKKG